MINIHAVKWCLALILVVLSSASFQTSPAQLPTCPDEIIQEALDILGEYTPSDAAGFIILEDKQFVLDNSVFEVRGINYYPAQYPWRRFLTETDLETLRYELQLLQDAGFNTLRIFLWNQALFNCPGSGAVPNWGVFQRLDGIIRNAGDMGFRLIVTLNDLPDLTEYRLYDNPSHIIEQTKFIINRYRDEAAILAWDLRNEGDIDYGSHNTLPGMFEREHVLHWLEETSAYVYELNPPQLTTAGWLNDSASTAAFVDFISFHHWRDAEELMAHITEIRQLTDKPILLQEFGYTTFDSNITPEVQAETIQSVIETTEEEGLLGWMIWTAFDFPREATCFPSPCRSEDNREHHFGIWQSDYTPKPAAIMLQEGFNAP